MGSKLKLKAIGPNNYAILRICYVATFVGRQQSFNALVPTDAWTKGMRTFVAKTIQEQINLTNGMRQQGKLYNTWYMRSNLRQNHVNAEK